MTTPVIQKFKNVDAVVIETLDLIMYTALSY